MDQFSNGHGNKRQDSQEGEGGDGNKKSKSELDCPYSTLTLHPLLIPHVVQTVFKYLPPAFLKTARLTSRDWNVEACHLTREKVPVVLVLSKLVNHLPQPSLALTNYMLTMEDTTDFPHAHFEFRKLLAHHRNLFHESIDVMRCFLDKFGPYIKYLHVDIMQADFHVNDLLIAIQNKMPSLETLSLAFNNYNKSKIENAEQFCFPNVKHFRIETNRSREEAYLTTIIPALFKIMPNLTRVSSACNSLHPYAENPNVMIGVLKAIKDGLANQLTVVDVLLKLDHEDIQALVEQTQFRPRNLLLSFDQNLSEVDFFSVLRKFSPSLETIGIKSSFEGSNPWDIFPGEGKLVLKSLKELTISRFFCGSINSMAAFPKLQKLKLNNLCLDEIFPPILAESMKWKRENRPLESLDISSCTAEPITIQTITMAFQNLKSLTFGADDSSIKFVYENLPQLEELNIAGEELVGLTDFGICGIACPSGQNQDQDDDTMDNVTCINGPSITRLQCLKKLKLEASALTDASVLFGIIHLKNLKSLTLGTPKITGRSVVALASKLAKLNYFNITLCAGGIPFEALSFAQKNIKGQFIIDDSRPGNREGRA